MELLNITSIKYKDTPKWKNFINNIIERAEDKHIYIDRYVNGWINRQIDRYINIYGYIARYIMSTRQEFSFFCVEIPMYIYIYIYRIYTIINII